MKFLICLLNDMDYADPSFVIKDKEKEAFRDAVERYSDTLNPGGVIEIEKKNEEGKFGRLVYRLNQNDEGGSRFHVTGIFSFDESKGSHLLVWHHAYNGVDFAIRFQGTYEECLAKRIELIKKSFDTFDYSDGDNEDFDPETGNVIDTGMEWEVYSIVDISKN